MVSDKCGVPCIISHTVFCPIEQHDCFRYPASRDQDDNKMRDIHDGDVVKHLMERNEFLSAEQNTGLVLCSDGVPVFKSSKGSLWPVYIMVTSIPPHL